MAVTSFQAIQPPYLLQATRVAIPVLDNDNNLTYSYMSSITTLRKLILQMTSSRIPLQSGESASKFDGSLHIVRSSDETILAYEYSSYTPRSLHVHSQLHHIHPSELCFLVSLLQQDNSAWIIILATASTAAGLERLFRYMSDKQQQ